MNLIRNKALCTAFLALALVLAALALSCPVLAQDDPTPNDYEVVYVVEVNPGDSTAKVRLQLDQPRDLVRELRFSIDPDRHSGFHGDGEIRIEAENVHWIPPVSGGQLQWDADLESQRKNGAFDGVVTSDWAIFRGDDLVPPTYTRSLKGSQSTARIRFELPAGWTAVTPYPPSESDDGGFLVDHPDRNFDRPTGWMALGELGVRRDIIADTRVAVAGPNDQGLRRQDMLAFLNWTLPTLKDIFPTVGDRLVIVSAGDPMWRGGLSGPGSLYIHADRPLISENGTSTLLHELVHVATSMRAAKGADWIVEGIAEYYSLQVLLRSESISERRYEKSMARLQKWSKDVTDPRTSNSRGATTARAVVILDKVDQAIRKATGGKKSLDDVVRTLVEEGRVSNERFVALAEDLAGKEIKALDLF